MPALTAYQADGRWWLPHNDWDLAAESVALAPPPDHVAVVVPYFEQPASLARMYAALAHAVPTGGRWEVIVVDDGSAEPPPGPPPAFPAPVRILRQVDLGCRPGAARNAGAAATDAEVLVFLDADTLPAPATPAALARWPAVVPDALVVGRRHHADLTGWSPADVAAWFDGRRPAPPRGADPAWLADGYARSANLRRVDDRSYQYVISAVMACGHALYDDIGGFDATRDEYGGDDWEFAFRAFNNGAVLVHSPDAVAWHDEPDWADRDGRAAVRNAQSSWLASAIPEPSTRGTGVVHHHADVIAEISLADTTPFGAAVATVTSLLAAAPDIAVHLDEGTAARVVRHFAADPRVRRDPVTVAAGRRARRRLRIERPVLWDGGGLRRLLERVAPGGPGHVDVLDGAAVVARLSSTRATGRLRRAPDAVDVAQLFGTACVDVRDLDAVVLDGEVDLAALHGGWLDVAAARSS